MNLVGDAIEYTQVGQDELDSSQEEKQDESRIRDLSGVLQRPAVGKLLITSNILLLGVYILSLLYVLKRQPSDTACVYKHSSHSPALPMITYEKPKHLNAEIVQKNKYRGPPSPEIDAAWSKIGLGTPAIRLFDSDLKALNKSDTPDRPLHRVPQEFGGGYIGMLEVFHLLHCLNSLRKAMDKEYYAEERAKAGEPAMRAHDEHCIDMLREFIMCEGDVTPITFYDNVLLPIRKLPMPDFNTLHTCRNFDAILEWNANNERTMQWDEMGLDLGDNQSIA